MGCVAEDKELTSSKKANSLRESEWTKRAWDGHSHEQ